MITSFGIIPFRKIQGKWEVLLVQHLKGCHWGFPKGRPEKDESAQDAAARELTEETGLVVQRYLSQESFTESYYVSGKKKTVSYFPAIVTGVLRCQSNEIITANWFSLEEAVTQISFAESQRIFNQVKKVIYEHTT